ncbi:hypothetical protein [Chitinophaga sp.]|uniref:hypothetical protein n=1 Tax=Chitinophaga sp. TaxID=1869181 RepID=UPI002B68957A|nr:hypothetical protein [Chitinophaga sp.]HWV64863.1 hypothetical protein [Chitinophaga sp.]
MQHILPSPPIQRAIAQAENILAWAVALLLPIAGYSLLIRLMVKFMEFLYEIFVRYQY